jgi:hypothetical protein
MAAPDLYWSLSNEQLAVRCNGPGPDRFGPTILAISSALLSPFLVVTDIHDVEWSQTDDRSLQRYHDSNTRLLVNGGIVARREPVRFEFFRPLSRPRLRATAEGLYFLVETSFAESVWMEGSSDG